MSNLFRFKCPKCGTVQDVAGNGPCWKCHTMISLPVDGVIWIYRKAFGGPRFGQRSMEINLNGILLNWLNYNDFIRIPVPYGHYNVMVKYTDNPGVKHQGTSQEFDITPDNRVVYLKVERSLYGYTRTVVLEPATADEMPPV